MKRRDILYEIYNKHITGKEAESIYQNAFEQFHEGTLEPAAEDYLCLSVSERTAFVLHGIPLEAVAQWRYEGWPNICGICGMSIDYKRGNWAALKQLRTGSEIKKNLLAHWGCRFPKAQAR